MARPTGTAVLPLHRGHVPAWLSTRMAVLGRAIVEAIVQHYGRQELLRRLAHPFWFQSFGAVMGMDWHSSGITTSVVGALKRGLQPVEHELGLHVCGGRGRHSRRTPDELQALGERVGLPADELARTSRLVAKVDSAAVQDGFDLYLHAFFVSDDGAWTVVQQGMSDARRQARRYHWTSEDLASFVEQPHAAIDGPGRGTILNLTDPGARDARRLEVELVRGGPDALVSILACVEPWAPRTAMLPHLELPAHHGVLASDVQLRRLHATLAAAADRGPRDFPELLLQPGVGPRTVSALALVAEVVHGAPSRFADPARFSMALGGKDGHPFPVPLHVYDETIRVLRDAVGRARLGLSDRLDAIRRLDAQTRLLESLASGPRLETLVALERRAAAALGGRTVFGPRGAGASPRPRPPRSRDARQLSLIGCKSVGSRETNVDSRPHQNSDSMRPCEPCR
jgi:hypothetical protein